MKNKKMREEEKFQRKTLLFTSFFLLLCLLLLSVADAPYPSFTRNQFSLASFSALFPLAPCIRLHNFLRGIYSLSISTLPKETGTLWLWQQKHHKLLYSHPSIILATFAHRLHSFHLSEWISLFLCL